MHDSKSPKILNYEREITTALKIVLQASRITCFDHFKTLIFAFVGIAERIRSHLRVLVSQRVMFEQNALGVPIIPAGTTQKQNAMHWSRKKALWI